jgi:YggT family protein
MFDGAGFWLYIIPNFTLAAAMYTLLGRYVLSLIFKPDSDKVIWRVFAQVTNPILHFVRSLTPAVVPDGLVMVFAIFWLLLARIFLLLLAVIFGFAPGLGGGNG